MRLPEVYRKEKYCRARGESIPGAAVSVTINYNTVTDKIIVSVKIIYLSTFE
ncbi:hypothetical protein K420107F6_32190 [Lactonifactor longoviformis]